ncbi:MAG: hypothetical protein QM820_14485 [Minicystis sp.]
MGHLITGDLGFEYGTFAGFLKLPLSRGLGGVGLGVLGLEPRWVLLDEEENALEDVFLSDLPPALRARLDELPRDRDDILVPMPANVTKLAAEIGQRMKPCAAALKEANTGCEEVRFALAPSWRLRPHEVEPAIEEVNHYLPKRKKVSRDWLLAQKGEGESVWDSEKIEARVEEIESDVASFLLCAVAWHIWHGEDRAMVYTVDPTLYAFGRDDPTPAYVEMSLGDRSDCAAQAEKWIHNYGVSTRQGDAAGRRAAREQALAWSSALSLTDPLVAAALRVSAGVHADTKDFMQAVSDATWAVVLHPSVQTFNTRGYCHHLAGNLEAAIADYTRAIELDGKVSMLWANRAEAWFDRSEYEKCVADAKQALALDGENAAARRYLAEAEQRLGPRPKRKAKKSG